MVDERNLSRVSSFLNKEKHGKARKQTPSIQEG